MGEIELQVSLDEKGEGGIGVGSGGGMAGDDAEGLGSGLVKPSSC